MQERKIKNIRQIQESINKGGFDLHHDDMEYLINRVHEAEKAFREVVRVSALKIHINECSIINEIGNKFLNSDRKNSNDN